MLHTSQGGLIHMMQPVLFSGESHIVLSILYRSFY